MGSAGKPRFRITEVLVLIALIGTLASIAVPSCMLLQKRVRVENLVKASRAFRQDMSALISVSLSKGVLPAQTAGDSGGETSTEVFYGESTLDDFAGLYREHYHLKSPVSGRPLLENGSLVGPLNNGPAKIYCAYVEPE